MLFFNRASRKGNRTLLRGATGIVGAVTLVGCGILGSGGSDTASTGYVGDELIAASKVDKAKILVTDVDPVLAFAGTGTDGNAKESDLSSPDCASATEKTTYKSAVFFNPNSLRRSVSDAQGISRRSGYFSSREAAKDAVQKSLLGKIATGVICLKSSRYNFTLNSLQLNQDRDSWEYHLSMAGEKGGTTGYQSKISYNVQFGSETIKTTVQNVTGKFDYHFVSRITLLSTNGDTDSWNFAPSQAAKDRMKSNLEKYLIQWKKDNPQSKRRKATSGTSDEKKTFASCDNGKTPRIFANVSAEMSKVLPGVKSTKEQLATLKGFDAKNHVYAEVKHVVDGQANMKAEQALDEFKLSQSKLIRLMTYTIPVGTPGRYELHLTPVRNGQKTSNSTVISFTLRHAKDEYSGNCSARIEDQVAVNDEIGLVGIVNLD